MGTNYFMLNIKQCFCFFYAGIDEIQISRGKVYRKALQALKQNRRLTEKMQQQAAKANLPHMDLFTGRRITLFYKFVTNNSGFYGASICSNG